MKKSEPRPKQIVRNIGREFPKAWRQIKEFRAEKGKKLPDWADWCYMPIAGTIAIAMPTAKSKKDAAEAFFLGGINPAVIAAAAAWRVSQGIYKFDADLYNALVEQPLDDKLPCEALKQLPEYCVYIEVPKTRIGSNGACIEGFWAHLEYDINDGREELRFVFFFDTGMLIPIPIHLGNWTLQEGVERYIKEAKKQAAIVGYNISKDIDNVDDLAPYVQLVLYLCAENKDMINTPKHPSTRTRMSGAIDVPKEPKQWDVGIRIGQTIRKYRNSPKNEKNNKKINEKEKLSGTHASPRAHVRRGHWHHYWTGKRDSKRKLIVKWLPPIPVGIDYEDENPSVIHLVK